MKSLLSRLEKAAEWLDREDPDEPAYDPVQLGAALISSLVAIGVLYWLLWTLLVYEGGLFSKLGALAQLAAGKDPGPDAFDGWPGNAGALVFCALAIAGLHRVYGRLRARR